MTFQNDGIFITDNIRDDRRREYCRSEIPALQRLYPEPPWEFDARSVWNDR
jgi:hypothetical protein